MATPHGYGDSENKTESEEYPSLFEALRDNGVRENESEEYTSPFESLDDNPKTFFSNDLILELDEGCVLDLTEEVSKFVLLCIFLLPSYWSLGNLVSDHY